MRIAPMILPNEDQVNKSKIKGPPFCLAGLVFSYREEVINSNTGAPDPPCAPS